MTRLLLDLGDAGEWAATVTVIAFIIQYSLLAKWWDNFVGRSIVGLDACLLTLLIPSVILLTKPHWAPFFASNWFLAIEVAMLFSVSYIMVTRIWGFTKIRRQRDDS